MGWNSNNWQTEAELRNKRLAEETSLQTLLNHVDWDADMLTLTIDGLTLTWDEITETDDVVTSTYIDDQRVITQNLKATNLWITGDSEFDGEVQMSQLVAGGLDDSDGYFTFDSSKLEISWGGSEDPQGGSYLKLQSANAELYAYSSVEISSGGSYSMTVDKTGITFSSTPNVNGYDVVLKGKANNFPQTTNISSMLGVESGSISWVSKATLKSWLGID